MLASKMQNILGVPDRVIFAYGYTFERESVYLMFVDGRVLRIVQGGSCSISYKNFYWDALNSGINRWYLGEDGQHGFNKHLLDILTACGNAPPLTSGGYGYADAVLIPGKIINVDV